MDANADTTDHRCPLCLVPANVIGSASYYDSDGPYNTPVFFCRACRIYGRIVTPCQISKHIPATSYVQPESEQRWLLDRSGFFKYLLKVIDEHRARNGVPARLADIGCSYGHLLELATRNGFVAMGTEVSPQLLETTRARGLNVMNSTEALPFDIDVITLIDSLYYLQNPVSELASLSQRLRKNGIVLIRITNRNWLADIRRRLSRAPDLSVLGDVLYSYSFHSLQILLHRAGLTVETVIPDSGVGKRTAWKKALAYKLLSAVTRLSRNRLLLAPGLIVVASQPRGNPGNSA